MRYRVTCDLRPFVEDYAPPTFGLQLVAPRPQQGNPFNWVLYAAALHDFMSASEGMRFAMTGAAVRRSW